MRAESQKPRSTVAVALLTALVAAACGQAATSGEGGERRDDRLTEAASDRPSAWESTVAQAAPSGSVCPARAVASEPLPGVRPEHRELSYWLERVAEQAGDLDEPVLTAEDVGNHNEAILLNQSEQPLGLYDLLAPIDVAELQTSIDERLAWMLGQFESGAYVETDGQHLAASELAAFQPVPLPDPLAGELHLATGLVPFRCGPRQAPFYTPSLDRRFDRNNCSSAHSQEVVQVLRTWPNGLRLARTRYTIGWIAPDAALSPPVPRDLRETLVTGRDLHLLRETTLTDGAVSVTLPTGTRLAPAHRGAHFATETGFFTSQALGEGDATSVARPLTRRAVLEEAFALLDAPYGWGGEGGGRDCSRFLLDIFDQFGLELPRHSAYQAHAGVFSIDVRGLENETERALLIDSAARHGIVLLHFPGHIMLYLGRNAEGEPMAIHAFAEYLEPCPEGSRPEGDAPETLYEVGGVTVSNLELGRGTSRTAFIERITHIVVLGHSPGLELAGIAQVRPAAPVQVPERRACSDTQEVALFQIPLQPSRDQGLRVIATSQFDLGPVELTLVDPDGERLTPEPRRLGGPPWAWDVRVERPQPGRWQAVLGDGTRVEACWPIYVRGSAEPTRTAPLAVARLAEERAASAVIEAPPVRRPAEAVSDDDVVPVDLDGMEAPEPEPLGPDLGPVWELRRTWGPATENLYATWVESLFDYPIDEDLTWTSLSDVLRDPDRNFLYNYLSAGEDDRRNPDDEDEYAMFLQPDCADLPYLLRSYYTWKMGLPYSFRRCARGYAGHPPGCMEINTNLMPRAVEDDVMAYDYFANREVRRAVHSASGRTHPEYEFSDYYPVALTRETLLPGTLFADPYGHLLVVVEWVPQGIDTYGMLIGADAQPDGTVGRRRFWRGTFLFHPDTTDVGAGFKHFRPVYRPEVPGTEPLDVFTNEALLETNRFARLSLQQYEGTADDFYDTMEALINPRPLDPVAMQLSLVDALAESVVRRIVSVDNGEDYLGSTGFRTVEMPEGYEIFETVGAWEDFSTPARDMRLLISIDTVMGFPDVVRRAPERFGLTPENAEEAALAVEARLDEALRAFTFGYIRSDGSAWTLSLHDVVERAPAFEMAYNPNDCVELRWAAPEGSTEHAPCARHAPAAQRLLMDQYREWFQLRRRPPR